MNVTTKILKAIILMITIAIALSSLAFVGDGLVGVYKALHALVTGDQETLPLLDLLESVDVFLVGLVFIILAIGLSELFFGQTFAGSSKHLEWLHFRNFLDLKLVLWETILTTMFIIFFLELYEHRQNPDWTLLIFPATILLISLSLYILKARGKD